MSTWVYDPWGQGDGHHFADTVLEQDKPQQTQLLGPDGRPLQYARRPMGFDLRQIERAKQAQEKRQK